MMSPHALLCSCICSLQGPPHNHNKVTFASMDQEGWQDDEA